MRSNFKIKEELKTNYNSIKINLKYFVLSFIIITFIYSCTKKDEKVKEEFNRSEMLKNFSENIIIPNYTELNSKAKKLKTATETFTQETNIQNLNFLKEKWFQTYLQWQHCKMFDFGPAFEETLMKKLNIFPIDTIKIETNITSGNYDFNFLDQTKAQGLSVLDYILYHKSSQEVIDEMNTNRKKYLIDVVNKIQESISKVYNAWDLYKTKFINSTGTDASSSTSYLVNEMNKDFERIKTVKFKFPLGIHVVNIPQPDLLECKYSKKSFELAKENTIAIQNVYNGNSKSGKIGIGFDDYLTHLGENGKKIKTNTLNEFQEIINCYSNYSRDFSNEMKTNYNQVFNHYEKYQNMVYHLKSELPSSISILITYEDNDGD